MDLRPYGLSELQIARAATVLNYQPFRISDAIVTGVGHSWLHETSLAEINRPQLLFDATRDPPDRWANAVAAAERLDRSYETFLDAIVGSCPGGSYLDLCCNSGYFPVKASARGDGCDRGGCGRLYRGVRTIEQAAWWRCPLRPSPVRANEI